MKETKGDSRLDFLRRLILNFNRPTFIECLIENPNRRRLGVYLVLCVSF